jgi:hypothetical protein
VISSLRQDFNSRFRPQDYRNLLRNLDVCASTHVTFRVAETPVFLPESLLNAMAEVGADLTHSLLANEQYLKSSAKAIPEACRAADQTPHPHFMTADFGLVRGSDGSLQPMLVELQAFPSIFAFQFVLAENYRAAYELDSSLGFFLGGHTELTFWKKFERIVLRGHHHENVVLLEIDPERQKTLPDFNLTADRLGIRVLNIADVIPEDRPGKLPRLCYRDGKRLVPIHRIYNRVVPTELTDEVAQKHIRPPFDYRECFDVEWADHPDWYFRLSKFSLPFLRHPAVPPAVFLDHWLDGKDSDRLPEDREHLVLKPLFSFAGQGIRFAPSDDDLNAIPPVQRQNYLLQERVDFAHVIETPSGPTQPEIRILYLWPDGGRLEPVLPLVRLGRGPMMGVDHAKNLAWAGVSAAFFPPELHKLHN